VSTFFQVGAVPVLTWFQIIALSDPVAAVKLFPVTVIFASASMSRVPKLIVALIPVGVAMVFGIGSTLFSDTVIGFPETPTI
jgi:hypothetical protein